MAETQRVVFRLKRAADCVRAGAVVELADRKAVAACLDAAFARQGEALKTKQGFRAFQVAMADHLANSMKMSREQAAEFSAQNPRAISALVRAIGRKRTATLKRRRRK